MEAEARPPRRRHPAGRGIRPLIRGREAGAGRGRAAAFGEDVENLTACNFLAGSGGNGNQIWWTGGAGSGQIGMGAFRGAYLNATSTFYGGEATAATYGIFAGNARGPGVWNQVYTSNFNDSGLYVGACRQVCNTTISGAWSQYSALGYSGTNSGGRIVVRRSVFDHNRDGFDTNSQNNSDAPSPQDGRCPNGRTSPLTHSVSCWVFTGNYVHDNNNPNTPGRRRRPDHLLRGKPDQLPAGQPASGRHLAVEPR